MLYKLVASLPVTMWFPESAAWELGGFSDGEKLYHGVKYFCLLSSGWGVDVEGGGEEK